MHKKAGARPQEMLFSDLDLLFSETPLEGPEQMAFDELLLREAKRPLLRLYCWKAPCVSFGYFQAWKRVQASYPNDLLVRRWSGGGCVEHRGDATFSLVVPANNRAGKIAPARFYQELHEAIAATLKACDYNVHLVGAGETITGEACFTAPALHDVMIGTQKILGGAQRRSHGSFLHQGSLSLPSEYTLPKKTMFHRSLFSSLATHLAQNITPIQEKESDLEKILHLAAVRYRSVLWTQKR